MYGVTMLPAAHGDSLLIEYGQAEAPRRVLIDGGPASTYDTLKSTLGLAPKLELLVVSHVDGDHIEGIVKLLGDINMTKNIGEIWFNAWKHLPANPRDQLGPVQGEYLSALIQERKLRWNTKFDGNAIQTPEDGELPCVTLPGGMELTILSPTPAQLLKLRRVWAREVAKAGLDPDNPQAALSKLEQDKRLRPSDALGSDTLDLDALAATPFDPGLTDANCSSIAFLAEYQCSGSGKKVGCLFLADADAEVIKQSLRRLCKQRGVSAIEVEAVKVSHHGSKNNTSLELLKYIKSSKFLVSTNGATFKHPDHPTIARIIRGGGDTPTILFNYRSKFNEVWSDRDIQRREKYTAFYQDNQIHGARIELC